MDKNFNALKDNRVIAASCPRLYESAWVSARGAIASKDYNIAVKMEDASGFLTVTNDLLNAMEELKWGMGSVLADATERKVTVFETIKQVIDTGLLPHLIGVKGLLDKKLR